MTKKPVKKRVAASAAKKRASNPNHALDAVFGAYPKPVKAKLLALRRLIFDTAKSTSGVGVLEEALKWGQPSYLTTESKSGSTIRIDQVKAEAGRYVRGFECPNCEATFETTDESDAEIQAMAERMVRSRGSL